MKEFVTLVVGSKLKQLVHQQDMTGLGFVVTEEAEAPLSKFSVALRGSQKRAPF